MAVGIFALGIGAILGLMPGMLREQEAADATLTALRLPDAVQSELRRMAGGNPAVLRSRLAGGSAEGSGALRLVADRKGGDLREIGSGDGREEFFVVELFRFPTAEEFDEVTAALAVRVRVSWPFRASGVETPAAQREAVEFNLVLNR